MAHLAPNADNGCRLGHLADKTAPEMARLAPNFGNGCRLDHFGKGAGRQMASLAPKVGNDGCRLGHLALASVRQMARLAPIIANECLLGHFGKGAGPEMARLTPNVEQNLTEYRPAKAPHLNGSRSRQVFPSGRPRQRPAPDVSHDSALRLRAGRRNLHASATMRHLGEHTPLFVRFCPLGVHVFLRTPARAPQTARELATRSSRNGIGWNIELCNLFPSRPAAQAQVCRARL